MFANIAAAIAPAAEEYSRRGGGGRGGGGRGGYHLPHSAGNMDPESFLIMLGLLAVVFLIVYLVRSARNQPPAQSAGVPARPGYAPPPYGPPPYAPPPFAPPPPSHPPVVIPPRPPAPPP